MWRARAAILTLVGVLGVHEGRYMFASPEHEHELAGAHAYLTWLLPAAGVLLFLAAAQLAARVARPDGGSVELRLPPPRVLWMTATATLLCVFVAQETVESALTHGHLPELNDIFGAGGWVALPLTVAAGALIAILLRGAATVLRWALRRSEHRPRRMTAAAAVAPARVVVLRGSVLARRLAGRGPPAVA